MRKIASLPKLRVAWTKINKRNSRSSGVDGVSIATFQLNSDKHLKNIAEQIAQGTYKFRGSRGTLIPKSDGKHRPLKIATVSDRVVAKALALYLEPKLQKFDQPCSFAYRKKLGTRDAVAEIHRLAKSGSKWVLEADIKKFFDKVDREILLKKLGRVVRSSARLNFVRQALTSEIENISEIDRDLVGLFPAAHAGIPQGNILSPLLANFYMYLFDKAMVKRGYGLVRYADDFVVMCKTKEEAEAAYTYAQKFLKDTLDLDLHEISLSGKTTIKRYTDGFEFLGFFIRDQKQMPAPKSKTKYMERIKEILRMEQSETLLRKVQRLNNVSKGWYEAYRTAELESFPKEADDLVYKELSRFLKEKKIFRRGDNLSWHQVRFLGVKTLGERVRDAVKIANKTASTHKGRGPRSKPKSNLQVKTVLSA